MLLSLNAGSSSLKFALYTRELKPVVRGEVDGTRLIVAHRQEADFGKAEAVVPGLLRWLAPHGTIAAAGHRIVHGGPDYAAPVLVTDAVLADLDALTELAPLHQPAGLAPIRALRRLHPDLLQVVCFDTAFHRTMPEVATRLPLPPDLGLRRYGFHGLSYEFIAGAVRARDPALAAGRVIAAHLGNGASLCAMRDGQSVETTMSFSALDGLIMGTRPGALDPGVLLYLLQARQFSAARLEDLLYHGAGLKGISGLSSDMRALLASDAPAARAAVESFVYRLGREAASLAGVLGGLDGVVFTGGIGEHAAAIRAMATERLAWLGARLDDAANARGEGVISAHDSSVKLWVIATDEEGTIARHTANFL